MRQKKINVKDKGMARKVNYTSKYKNPPRPDPLYNQVIIRRQQQREIQIEYNYTIQVWNRKDQISYKVRKQMFQYKGKFSGLEQAQEEWENKRRDQYDNSDVDILGMTFELEQMIEIKKTDILDLFIGQINS